MAHRRGIPGSNLVRRAFCNMGLLYLISLAIFFSLGEGKAIPQANLKATEKGFEHLVIGLRGIELWRREILKNALENPKYKEDTALFESLQLLNEVDSYLIKARKYYESINILIESEENSAYAKETFMNIAKLREKLNHIKDTVQTRAKAFKPAKDIPKDGELHLVKAAFDATAAQCSEIETKLRQMAENSPHKYLKDIKSL